MLMSGFMVVLDHSVLVSITFLSSIDDDRLLYQRVSMVPFILRSCNGLFPLSFRGGFFPYVFFAIVLLSYRPMRPLLLSEEKEIGYYAADRFRAQRFVGGQ